MHGHQRSKTCSIGITKHSNILFADFNFRTRFKDSFEELFLQNVIHSFTQTAKLPDFRFFGGVTIGSTISVQELLRFYHAVILAYGASKDRKLGIPGEDGTGVIAAKDFVGW